MSCLNRTKLENHLKTVLMENLGENFVKKKKVEDERILVFCCGAQKVKKIYEPHTNPIQNLTNFDS